MAIESYENNLIKYQQTVQDIFKVKNPYLLKTGTLGTIINILSHQEYDTMEYYNKLFQELSPSLAKDFNSMLFHSTFYNVNIDLAEPANFSIYLQVPKLNTENVDFYEYIVPANYAFKDYTGMFYIIENEIQIIQNNSRIKAYSYNQLEGKTDLSIITTTDQLGNELYLVQIDNVKQYKRNFYKINIPFYDIGQSYYFDINISDYKKINKMKVWYNSDPTNNFVDKLKLPEFSSDKIGEAFAIKPVNIKYYDFGSSRFDLDIFLDIKTTTLTFKTGNGIRGMYLPEGTELILEIDETEGIYGNKESMEFTADNILVKTNYLDGTNNYYKTSLTGFSVSGGTGGKLVEDVDSIRTKIFDKIKLRNSIVTESDFETAFTMYSKPFIDTKFINNNSVIFIFNELKYNDSIVETTSVNLTETQISSNPFYPVINQNGKDLILPFYFKKLNNNVTQAFMVNPKISVPLYTNTSVDTITRLNNEISLYITYDFNTNKSYIKLKNVQNDHEYNFSCNLFNIKLNYGNNFTYEVNTKYTDSYCIIKDYIYNIKIDIYDQNGKSVMTWFNDLNDDRKYYQLELKQEFYKYYLQIPPQDFDIPETTAALDYLDNEFADIVNTIEDLYQPIKDGELPYLLRIPAISKDFYDSIDIYEFYSLLTSFFKINNYQNQFSITSRIQQCFYNTINIDKKYIPYIFKQNDGSITNPKIPIIVNLIINKDNLLLSNYDNEYDLEFAIKLDIVNFLITKEGFEVNYFDTELENLIYNKYNENVKLIENIEFISPQIFQINSSDDIYYQVNKDLGIIDVINFIPPYFYYDYNNITINTRYY